MSTVNVKRDELLVILQQNRALHADRVATARRVYHDRVVEELEDRLAAAAQGETIDPGFLHRLPIPGDYTNEYDRVIDQMTWEVNEVVQLEREDFNRYVRDEWEWAGRFFASSSQYLP